MITNFICSKEQFQIFSEHFTAAANAKRLTSSDILLNNIIRGKDVRRGFTPITNPTKLNSGTKAWQGFDAARGQLIANLRYSCADIARQYGIDIPPEMSADIIRLAKGE